MSKKPNILIIMTDQQSAHMMSCAGNRWLETSAMDSLSRDGIRFENAYCTNPVCCPSRISMATGLMSCRLDADTNEIAGEIEFLPDEIVNGSMGPMMKRAGYETFYGGKVHLCNSLNPDETGYDTIFRNDREELPDACIDFIKQPRDKPFFAVASFINPHDICFAHWAKNDKNHCGVQDLRKQALELPDDQLPPLPENYAIPSGEPSAVQEFLDPKAVTPAIAMRDEYDDYEWRINRWIYHRLTEQVDALIGQILNGLKAAGHHDDTFIIFTSDHGNMDASHHLSSKSLFYEESVQVPFIMKLPGLIPSGQVDKDHLISSGLDILPTLCDYAGVRMPVHLQGCSLRALAEGRPVDSWRPYVASENNWFRMIRTKDYKYCAFADKTLEWLGDMANDPGELQNLAADPGCKGILEKHRQLLTEWSKLTKDEKIGNFT